MKMTKVVVEICGTTTEDNKSRMKSRLEQWAKGAGISASINIQEVDTETVPFWNTAERM